MRFLSKAQPPNKQGFINFQIEFEQITEKITLKIISSTNKNSNTVISGDERGMLDNPKNNLHSKILIAYTPLLPDGEPINLL